MQVIITEFDLEYHTLNAVKGQAIAKHLTAFPYQIIIQFGQDFPDEEIFSPELAEETPKKKF